MYGRLFVTMEQPWIHDDSKDIWVAPACRIPFFVAAPTTTLDPSLPDGTHIKIEERPSEEVTHWRGQAIAPASTNVRQPSFPPHLHVNAPIQGGCCATQRCFSQ